MARIPAVVRELSVVLLAIFVVITFTGGAVTHAVLTDTEPADNETISLAKKNQGAVTFGNCDKVDFEPDDPNNFVIEVGTDTDVHAFDETDFPKNKFTIQSGNNKKIPGDELIRNATLDGTTYNNPNYDPETGTC